MEVIANVSQTSLADNVTNVRQELMAFRPTAVKLVIVIAWVRKTTSAILSQGNVTAIQKLTEENVINVKLVTGTSPTANLATATVMLPLVIQKLENVTSAKISRLATTAIVVLKDITEIRYLAVTLDADLAVAQTRLLQDTHMQAIVHLFRAVTTSFAIVNLVTLEPNVTLVMIITSETLTNLVAPANSVTATTTSI